MRECSGGLSSTYVRRRWRAPSVGLSPSSCRSDSMPEARTGEAHGARGWRWPQGTVTVQRARGVAEWFRGNPVHIRVSTCSHGARAAVHVQRVGLRNRSRNPSGIPFGLIRERYTWIYNPEIPGPESSLNRTVQSKLPFETRNYPLSPLKLPKLSDCHSVST